MRKNGGDEAIKGAENFWGSLAVAEKSLLKTEARAEVEDLSRCGTRCTTEVESEGPKAENLQETVLN